MPEDDSPVDSLMASLRAIDASEREAWLAEQLLHARAEVGRLDGSLPTVVEAGDAFPPLVYLMQTQSLLKVTVPLEFAHQCEDHRVVVTWDAVRGLLEYKLEDNP